jgi:hypothetical protein
MSGSPKYAPVYLTAQRQVMLEAARRARIEERRRAAEERARRAAERHQQRLVARRARLDERRRQIDAEAADLASRIEAAVGLTEQQRAGLRERAAQVDAGDGAAAAEARLRAVQNALAVAEGRAEAATAAIERSEGLDRVVVLLDTVDDRLRLDTAGSREVDDLLHAARRVLHDPRRFARAQETLAERVRDHLAAVETARTASEQVASAAEEAIESLEDVLKEAADAGVQLAGQQEAERLRARLAADVASGLVAPARHGAAALAAAVTRMEEEIEVLLDALRAAALIVDAAVEALPAVGFQVDASSIVQEGASVAFDVVRTDGAMLQMRIEPTDEGARLAYEGSASDYVLERGPDGIVARCDVTEELLERFHEELTAQGVETGELHWEGKPSRPARRAARIHNRATVDPRHRDRRS